MADDITLNPATGGELVAADEITRLNAVGLATPPKVQRVKVGFGPDGELWDADDSHPLPVSILRSDAKDVVIYATSVTGTTTDTLLTLSVFVNDAVTSSTSYTPPAGYYLRLMSVTLASRGHATATAQVSQFSLRMTASGTLSTSSPVMLRARTATPATALAWDRFGLSLPEGGFTILGDGSRKFGISVLSTFTTNAPTVDVLLTGQLVVDLNSL